ncbi:MAG: hypothetical protein HJJLKODD_02327 [Phycisphaerae bacterium]|nr:hypothetical protein [Phycisphaerae bacterium]
MSMLTKSVFSRSGRILLISALCLGSWSAMVTAQDRPDLPGECYKGTIGSVTYNGEGMATGFSVYGDDGSSTPFTVGVPSAGLTTVLLNAQNNKNPVLVCDDNDDGVLDPTDSITVYRPLVHASTHEPIQGSKFDK